MSHLVRIAALAAAVAGCGSDPSASSPDPFEARQLPEELRADAASVVQSGNRFAVDLYARLAPEPGNLFFSPFSVSTALAMTHAGARAVTAEEMARVLHFSLEPASLHPAYSALIRSLDTGSGLGGYRLNVANRLWGQTGYGFLEPFLAITRGDYGAELAQLDFVAAPEPARAEINGWVEERTEGKIVDLFPPGTIGELTRLVLVNAIYFKGSWADRFDEADTRSNPFHLSASASVDVPTMSQTGEFARARVEDVDVLELPYQGGDVSMVILLPAAVDGLASLEARLTFENLTAWLAAVDGVEPRDVEVSLPRFRTRSSFLLNDVLASMGMPAAFDPFAADFSGMNGRRDLFVSVVVHQGFVEVSEEGTEAAAATGVVEALGYITSAPPAFRVDHPFLFLIRDNLTGSVLFLGRIVDPSA
ncbi:MAG: serpin family protein [bacterium]